MSEKELTTVRLTMYIMRHGVALHNITHPSPYDPMYTDSQLVLPRAHQQARKAAQALKQSLQKDEKGRNGKAKENKIHLDGVIVSPLTRCLQTAYLVVDDLMAGGCRNDNDVFTKFPWICKEDLREAFGIRYSGKRSCKSFLQTSWPKVEFEMNMTELDEKWKPDESETFRDVFRRIHSFLLWLLWVHLEQMISQSSTSSHEHKQYLVVSHGVWIECLFQQYAPHILNGGTRVHNCDLYRIDVVSEWRQKEKPKKIKWKCLNISFENVELIHS